MWSMCTQGRVDVATVCAARCKGRLEMARVTCRFQRVALCCVVLEARTRARERASDTSQLFETAVSVIFGGKLVNRPAPF